MSATDELLLISLQVSVPMAIHELRETTPEERVTLAHDLAQTIASEGDNLLFRSKVKGATARVHTALARGLAIAAYQPGGVTFAGQHWCTDHQACEEAERWATS